MKLYVHIPFCHAKCAYCDFYSTPRSEWMEAFIGSAINEWQQRSAGLTEEVDTLYLGGGTPSSLAPKLLKQLVDSLPTDNLREATIEANPEDVTDEWVRFIVSETPFRRVSMGVQSFSDRELQIVGRRHSSSDAANAIIRLRKGGIDNLSCDLIYGLPGQTPESWSESINRLINFHPEHISAYLLSYEAGTRLEAMRRSGKIKEADEDTVETMYRILCESTHQAGYAHYEISNFALPGREAIHNSAYWDDSAYIGIGPGAHSFDGNNRSYNPTSLKDYLKANGIDIAIVEEETNDSRFNDMIITRLRTAKGIRPEEIENRFGKEMSDFFIATALPLIETGDLILTSKGAYIIPETRWLTSNSIILPFIRV